MGVRVGVGGYGSRNAYFTITKKVCHYDYFILWWALISDHFGGGGGAATNISFA